MGGILVLFLYELFAPSPLRGSFRRLLFTPTIIKENVYVDLDRNAYQNYYRIKFYETYKFGYGCYGLRYAVKGIDNGYATYYLLVKEGKLYLTIDRTDQYEWPFTFVTYELKDVDLSYYDREAKDSQYDKEVVDTTEDRYRDLIIKIKR